MKDKRCDLHIHSNFSDSDADLESIFKQAKEQDLACIAITDHDTVDGLARARLYSKTYNVELVEALELSAEHNNLEVHILAYFINSDDQRLKSELAHIRGLRRERLIWMGEKLNSLGIEVNMNELFLDISGAVPTRLHLALYLLKKGKVKTLAQAFNKYLSPGRPAYRARFKYSVNQAIQFIKGFGGLSILAHPHMIFDQSWVEEFIALGIDGLETIYPNMSQALCSRYKNLANRLGLLQSGGSDAHGSYKKFINIGKVDVSYEWVEEMKRRCGRDRC